MLTKAFLKFNENLVKYFLVLKMMLQPSERLSRAYLRRKILISYLEASEKGGSVSEATAPEVKPVKKIPKSENKITEKDRKFDDEKEMVVFFNT